MQRVDDRSAKLLSQVECWRSRLLDIGNRNPLVSTSFNPTRGVLEFAHPEPETIWRKLVIAGEAGSRALRFPWKRDLAPPPVNKEPKRVIERACQILIDSGFMASVEFQENSNHTSFDAVFFKQRKTKVGPVPRKQAFINNTSTLVSSEVTTIDSHHEWLGQQNELELRLAEDQAFEQGFGSKLERQLIEKDRKDGKSVLQSGRLRQEFIRRFMIQGKTGEREKQVRAS